MQNKKFLILKFKKFWTKYGLYDQPHNMSKWDWSQRLHIEIPLYVYTHSSIFSGREGSQVRFFPPSKEKKLKSHKWLETKMKTCILAWYSSYHLAFIVNGRCSESLHSLIFIWFIIKLLIIKLLFVKTCSLENVFVYINHSLLFSKMENNFA